MSEFPTDSVWCVVPVYNNAATVKDVALACRRHLSQVLIVDDGSTDADVPGFFSDTDIEVVRHPENRGKGRALSTALHHVKEQGGSWMITVDADGQHDPDDIPAFLPMIKEFPDSILVG